MKKILVGLFLLGVVLVAGIFIGKNFYGAKDDSSLASQKVYVNKQPITLVQTVNLEKGGKKTQTTYSGPTGKLVVELGPGFW